jgi:hypothetical protein
MSPAQSLILYTGLVLQVILLAGLVRHEHWRRGPVFTIYIGAFFVTQGLIGIAPQRFYNWQFWLLHLTIVSTLRFGVALELAHRLFRGFPGASASAWNAMLVLIVITSVAVVSVDTADADYEKITGVIVPRIAHGTAWILTALCALVLWYRLPLAAMDRAILLGLTPYLLVFTVTMSLLSTVGWQIREQSGFANTFAFMLLMGYWARVAWSVRAPVDSGGPPGAMAGLYALPGKPA